VLIGLCAFRGLGLDPKFVHAGLVARVDFGPILLVLDYACQGA
jgi:hypothetical protein